jgi:hypothetical protein
VSPEEGQAKYVYGVVRASVAGELKAAGIHDRPLDVVCLDELGAVTSDIEADPLEAGRDELLAHAHALEDAFAHGPVLPMQFGIVMAGEKAVRDELLAEHREELVAQLDELEGKVEVNVKGIYDEARILAEVVAEDRRIAALRERISGASEAATYPERIELGELVSAALEAKREVDAEAIIARLAPHAISLDIGPAVHERMAVSCSFLIDTRQLETFDRELDAVGDEQGGRITFKYTGPLPPHSFVELALEA